MICLLYRKTIKGNKAIALHLKAENVVLQSLMANERLQALHILILMWHFFAVERFEHYLIGTTQVLAYNRTRR